MMPELKTNAELLTGMIEEIDQIIKAAYRNHPSPTNVTICIAGLEQHRSELVELLKRDQEGE